MLYSPTTTHFQQRQQQRHQRPAEDEDSAAVEVALLSSCVVCRCFHRLSGFQKPASYRRFAQSRGQHRFQVFSGTQLGFRFSAEHVSLQKIMRRLSFVVASTWSFRFSTYGIIQTVRQSRGQAAQVSGFQRNTAGFHQVFSGTCLASLLENH